MGSRLASDMVAGIAAEERPREDSQAIGVGILAVGEDSLSCPVVEHRTVVAGIEVVHTAGVRVNRSRARVAFHKVVEEVSRIVLEVAFHIATGVAHRSPEAVHIVVVVDRTAVEVASTADRLAAAARPLVAAATQLQLRHQACA